MPAYPQKVLERARNIAASDSGVEPTMSSNATTFREQTAARVLASLVANPNYSRVEPDLAADAVDLTDRLIIELAAKPFAL